MKASEYINCLHALIAEHGDLEVNLLGSLGNRIEAPTPKIAFKKVLSKRERKPAFWYDWKHTNLTEIQGEKVIRLI